LTPWETTSRIRRTLRHALHRVLPDTQCGLHGVAEVRRDVREFDLPVAVVIERAVALCYRAGLMMAIKAG
jgi:hypothetical protein